MLRIRNYLSFRELLKRTTKRFSIVNFRDRVKHSKGEDSFMMKSSHLYLNENVNQNIPTPDHNEEPSILDQNIPTNTLTDYELINPDESNFLELEEEQNVNDKIEDYFNVNKTNFKSNISFI